MYVCVIDIKELVIWDKGIEEEKKKTEHKGSFTVLIDDGSIVYAELEDIILKENQRTIIICGRVLVA